MTGRMLPRVLLGLLLPVPLILVLTSTLFPRPQPRPHEKARFSPVLTEEDRWSLLTYLRDCKETADCDPPLGCLLDTRVHRFYCTDSECVLDSQCPAGFSCQTLATAANGPWVRFCLPHGVRKEGESCLSTPSDQATACEEGLLCGEGWCGRPCQLDEPASCPEGFFCADTVPRPACRPTCMGRTCPEGQQCVHDSRKGASACAVVYGRDCQRSPCGDGQKCLAVFSMKAQQSAWMECWPECGKGLAPCAPGLLCDGRTCGKPCEPDGPNVCEPGFRCLRYNDRQQWLCRPDM